MPRAFGVSAPKARGFLILDVPAEFAEQIELLGIYQFDKCIYDQERKQISLSACTTFYRKGGLKMKRNRFLPAALSLCLAAALSTGGARR